MIKNWITSLSNKKHVVASLPSGLYSYLSPSEDPSNYRLHLRLEENGKAVLLVNASTVLHLNETAAEYAYFLVNNLGTGEIVNYFNKKYQTNANNILQDYRNLKEKIDILTSSQNLDPVSYLDLDRQIPFTEDISAPYRLDCALTYQLPEGSIKASSPIKRVDRELSTNEWKGILDKSWAFGIPQILFTGGEPTLSPDLISLLEHAEKNGQITGLITNGRKLGDPAYLDKLLQAGLDHTMIVLEPEDNKSWESLSSFAYWAETLNEDLFVAAHLTLTKENSLSFLDLIDKIIESGVSAISLSENNHSLSNELKNAREYLDDKDIELIWDLPVPYSSLNPVSLELEQETDEPHPNGAGKAWLYVEPDGDVLPAQGINKIIGNLLTDDWATIWEKAIEINNP